MICETKIYVFNYLTFEAFEPIQTYQNPKGLEQRLNRMKDQLLAGADKIKLPGDAPDKMHDVNGRILHLVFPDVPLTTEQTNVLTSFINNPDNKFEVIITIVTS